MTRHARTPAIVPSRNGIDFERASLELFARLRLPAGARHRVALDVPADRLDRAADAGNDAASRSTGPGRLAA